MLTQLRTGHAPLNYHLHWGIPFCQNCRNKRETVFHFIMSCSAYQEHRTRLRDKIPQELYTFASLLSHRKCIEELLLHVECTGRLSHIFRSGPIGGRQDSRRDKACRTPNTFHHNWQATNVAISQNAFFSTFIFTPVVTEHLSGSDHSLLCKTRV